MAGKVSEQLNKAIGDFLNYAPIFSGHIANKLNPHGVTKDQVGLSNVTNNEQATKTEFSAHANNKSNPHNVTKTQVGLSNLTNDKQATETALTAHTSNASNPHAVTKSQVGLSNVTNDKQATKLEYDFHVADTDIHVTAAKQAKWDSMPAGLQYSIAPSNAINKDRADLILTGTNDAAAINAAFAGLAALRSSDDVAIRIDFMGGDITVAETINIPTNFLIYGNGVKLTAATTSTIIIEINPECTVFIDRVNTTGGSTGISNNYGTAAISNCTCNSNGSIGIANSGTAIISNCTCNSNVARGINNYGTATISNCTCNGNGVGIYISSSGTKSIIIANRCLNNNANISDAGTGTVLANNITT